MPQERPPDYFEHQAHIVQKMDTATSRINHQPLPNAILVSFNIYPLNSVIYLLEAGTGSKGAKSTDLKFDVVGNRSL